MTKETSTYQRVRSHLAYLKLQAAAERLAPALEDAQKAKPSYADFLDELLGAEVAASEARRLERRLRFAGPRTESGSRSSTSPPNHRSTAGSSKSSRHCASSRSDPTS